MIINAPLYEMMRIDNAAMEGEKVTVTLLSEDPDVTGEVLEIDGSTWQLRRMITNMGAEQIHFEIKNQDLGGKWVTESTVLRTPMFKKITRFEYTLVEGIHLPSKITVEHEGKNGQQLMPRKVYEFSGWQVNKEIPDGVF